MTASATTTFDFGDLKRALEHSDAATLVRLYANDAEMVVVDRNRPPSSPMTLSGKEAIAAFWRDVCARDMTHRVGHEVVGPDRVAFVEECAYPDGCHVMSAMTLDLRDGRIARHLTVQAWDEVSCATG
ncbi:MAG TPA: nuclear transport factor 2 family protein [Azospirillum sp.]|nr:nuclear transport factor 2 family protein [Azospirillum sp.]